MSMAYPDPVADDTADQAPQVQAPGLAEGILDNHLRLDQAIDGTLNQVIGDTENSTLAIMQQVRELHDTAGKLVAYLTGSSQTAGNLGKEIDDSVAQVGEVGAFIRQLPAKMERDMKSVQAVVKEIKELSGMVEAVQAISMQSHLLAINAAIEASHAGNSGGAFRVVADEMRQLASNSSKVATTITQGLARARHVVEHGMAARIAESKQQLDQVSQAAASIQQVLTNFEDMNQYNKTRFTVITKHNEDLVKQIAEVMGQIQYQDVVRQCIERIRVAIGQRNECLQNAVRTCGLAQLPERLRLVLHDYMHEEEKHRHSAHDAPEDGGENKIELF
jgi:methyl-accepting chemotaxis protein